MVAFPSIGLCHLRQLADELGVGVFLYCLVVKTDHPQNCWDAWFSTNKGFLSWFVDGQYFRWWNLDYGWHWLRLMVMQALSELYIFAQIRFSRAGLGVSNYHIEVKPEAF